MNRLSLVLLCLLLAAPPAAGADDASRLGFDAAALTEIDAVVAAGIADGEMPGCVVCVGRRDGVALLKAYGDRRVEPTVEPMTPDTLFDLASLTKPTATATAVMTLIEAGKLAPDDLVAKHLPEFGCNGKEKITVAQLLTHTAGLIPDNALSDYADGPERAWERICGLKPTAEPGTAFKYSDVGFIVLGKLVERAAGRPLDAYCREAVYVPLGMTETAFNPGEELRRRAAPTERRGGEWLTGVVHDPRAAKLEGVAGHAGLFSTADDLAKYARAMLRSLSDPPVEGLRLLAPETAALMTRPRPVPGGLRAYGWDVRTGYSSNRGEGFGDAAFGHGGFTGTALWIDPEHDLFVIFLSNRLHPDGRGSVNKIAGRVGTLAAAALRDR